MPEEQPLATEIGDELVVVVDSQAAALTGEAAEAYRQGGASRRTVLKAVAGGVALAGVSAIALPAQDAAASFITGNPSVSFTPTSGPMGTVLTVTGSNFAPTSTVSNSITSVTIGGIAVTPSSTTVTSTGTCSFTVTVPPGLTPGAITVSVTDAHHNTGSNTFTLNPATATLSTTTFAHKGSPGTFTVTASSGFFPSSSITITTTGGTFTAVSPSPVTATATGTINPATSFSITYGNGANSPGTVVFTDSKGNTATVSITTGG